MRTSGLMSVSSVMIACGLVLVAIAQATSSSPSSRGIESAHAEGSIRQVCELSFSSSLPCRPFASRFIVDEAHIVADPAAQPPVKTTLPLSSYTVPVKRDDEGAAVTIRSESRKAVLEPPNELVVTGTPVCEFLFQVPDIDALPCFTATMSSSMSDATGSDVLFRIALNNDIVIETKALKTLMRVERIDADGSLAPVSFRLISRNERDNVEYTISSHDVSGSQAVRVYLACGDHVVLRAGASVKNP